VSLIPSEKKETNRITGNSIWIRGVDTLVSWTNRVSLGCTVCWYFIFVLVKCLRVAAKLIKKYMLPYLIQSLQSS
jgi:hypothetical protein